MLDVYLDVTLPSIPCGLLSLDHMDSLGAHNMNITGGVRKVRLDKSGNAIDESDDSLG
jgi:hypothetical protein